MKLFALNLSLEFISKKTDKTYEFELLEFADLMSHFFKGTTFPGQKFYLSAEDSDEFLQQVFDLQSNNLWREIEVSVCFIFNSPKSLESFWLRLQDSFKVVDAAGGLVENEKGEFLFIFNRDRWTLPKGHVNWREEIEDAAIREVKEETGLREVALGPKLPETYHTFRKKKHWILKRTYWYKMSASSQQELVPEAKEKIEAAMWKSKKQWQEVANESYPLTRDLFQTELTKSLT